MIAVLSVIPPHPGVSVGPLDKLLHFVEYLLLAWCVVQASCASGWPLTAALIRAFLLSTGFGAFLEGVQGWLPYRQAEWRDIIANTVGAGLGGWLGVKTPLSHRTALD